MKTIALLSVCVIMTGCSMNYGNSSRRQGYDTDCTVDETVRAGRVINREARCAANPLGGVAKVSVGGRENYLQYWPIPNFTLSASQWARLKPILSRADADLNFEKQLGNLSNAYDFVIVVQEKNSHNRGLYISYSNVERFYGRELADWVKNDLPKIAKQAAAEDAKNPKLSEAEEDAELEQEMIKAGKWEKGKDGKIRSLRKRGNSPGT